MSRIPQVIQNILKKHDALSGRMKSLPHDMIDLLEALTSETGIHHGCVDQITKVSDLYESLDCICQYFLSRMHQVKSTLDYNRLLTLILNSIELFILHDLPYTPTMNQVCCRVRSLCLNLVNIGGDSLNKDVLQKLFNLSTLVRSENILWSQVSLSILLYTFDNCSARCDFACFEVSLDNVTHVLNSRPLLSLVLDKFFTVTAFVLRKNSHYAFHFGHPKALQTFTAVLTMSIEADSSYLAHTVKSLFRVCVDNCDYSFPSSKASIVCPDIIDMLMVVLSRAGGSSGHVLEFFRLLWDHSPPANYIYCREAGYSRQLALVMDKQDSSVITEYFTILSAMVAKTKLLPHDELIITEAHLRGEYLSGCKRVFWLRGLATLLESDDRLAQVYMDCRLFDYFLGSILNHAGDLVETFSIVHRICLLNSHAFGVFSRSGGLVTLLQVLCRGDHLETLSSLLFGYFTSHPPELAVLLSQIRNQAIRTLPLLHFINHSLGSSGALMEEYVRIGGGDLLFGVLEELPQPDVFLAILSMLPTTLRHPREDHYRATLESLNSSLMRLEYCSDPEFGEGICRQLIAVMMDDSNPADSQRPALNRAILPILLRFVLTTLHATVPKVFQVLRPIIVPRADSLGDAGRDAVEIIIDYLKSVKMEQNGVHDELVSLLSAISPSNFSVRALRSLFNPGGTGDWGMPDVVGLLSRLIRPTSPNFGEFVLFPRFVVVDGIVSRGIVVPLCPEPNSPGIVPPPELSGGLCLFSWFMAKSYSLRGKSRKVDLFTLVDQGGNILTVSLDLTLNIILVVDEAKSSFYGVSNPGDQWSSFSIVLDPRKRAVLANISLNNQLVTSEKFSGHRLLALFGSRENVPHSFITTGICHNGLVIHQSQFHLLSLRPPPTALQLLHQHGPSFDIRDFPEISPKNVLYTFSPCAQTVEMSQLPPECPLSQSSFPHVFAVPQPNSPIPVAYVLSQRVTPFCRPHSLTEAISACGGAKLLLGIVGSEDSTAFLHDALDVLLYATAYLDFQRDGVLLDASILGHILETKAGVDADTYHRVVRLSTAFGVDSDCGKNLKLFISIESNPLIWSRASTDCFRLYLENLLTVFSKSPTLSQKLVELSLPRRLIHLVVTNDSPKMRLMFDRLIPHLLKKYPIHISAIFRDFITWSLYSAHGGGPHHSAIAATMLNILLTLLDSLEDVFDKMLGFPFLLSTLWITTNEEIVTTAMTILYKLAFRSDRTYKHFLSCLTHPLSSPRQTLQSEVCQESTGFDVLSWLLVKHSSTGTAIYHTLLSMATCDYRPNQHRLAKNVRIGPLKVFLVLFDAMLMNNSSPNVSEWSFLIAKVGSVLCSLVEDPRICEEPYAELMPLILRIGSGHRSPLETKSYGYGLDEKSSTLGRSMVVVVISSLLSWHYWHGKHFEVIYREFWRTIRAFKSSSSLVGFILLDFVSRIRKPGEAKKAKTRNHGSHSLGTILKIFVAAIVDGWVRLDLDLALTFADQVGKLSSGPDIPQEVTKCYHYLFIYFLSRPIPAHSPQAEIRNKIRTLESLTSTHLAWNRDFALSILHIAFSLMGRNSVPRDYIKLSTACRGAIVRIGNSVTENPHDPPMLLWVDNQELRGKLRSAHRNVTAELEKYFHQSDLEPPRKDCREHERKIVDSCFEEKTRASFDRFQQFCYKADKELIRRRRVGVTQLGALNQQLWGQAGVLAHVLPEKLYLCPTEGPRGQRTKFIDGKFAARLFPESVDTINYYTEVREHPPRPQNLSVPESRVPYETKGVIIRTSDTLEDHFLSSEIIFLNSENTIDFVARCLLVSGNSINVTEGVLAFCNKFLVFFSEMTITSSGYVTDRVCTLPSDYDPFYGNINLEGLSEASKFRLEVRYRELTKVQPRRYLMMHVALELFVDERKSHFFAFTRESYSIVHDLFFREIKPVHNSFESSLQKIADVTRVMDRNDQETLTHDWCRGAISNFDYLMLLNFMAGRTFNDLMQYPIFPWVIADYESPTIDLTRKETFRDLTKPVGALTEERLREFIARYDDWPKKEDGICSPYLYATHYSSSAIVSHFMVRIEPFTQIFCQISGRKFDLPDRMFHSISESWESASRSSSSNLRELIPEFFYLPEFLLNTNHYNFGARQDGVLVNDVVLPPWAKDPAHFVRTNRLALESDTVSVSLPHWIDLIFGYKQQGRPAIEANNVFHENFYEQNCDFERCDTPRANLIYGYISNFGQIPIQIFTKPHPPRQLALHSFAPFFPPTFQFSLASNPENFAIWPKIKLKRKSIAGIRLTSRKIRGIEPNTLELSHSVKATWGNGSLYSTNDQEVFRLAGGRVTQCCAFGGMRILCGYESGAITLWSFHQTPPISNTIFHGHFSPIVALAACRASSLIVSACEEGRCLFWDSDAAVVVRELPRKGRFGHLLINPQTNDVVTVSDDSLISLWTINGLLVNFTDQLEAAVSCISFINEDQHSPVQILAAGLVDSSVNFINLNDLSTLCYFRLDCLSPTHPTCFLMTWSRRGLLVGDSDGQIWKIGQLKQKRRKIFAHALR